jgi:hypothetical protein
MGGKPQAIVFSARATRGIIKVLANDNPAGIDLAGLFVFADHKTPI